MRNSGIKKVLLNCYVSRREDFSRLIEAHSVTVIVVTEIKSWLRQFALRFTFMFSGKSRDLHTRYVLTQSVGAVKYTDCISAVRKHSFPTNDCPENDTKKSDGKVPVMLEFWGMWSVSSLPSLPGPFRPEILAPHRVISMDQIELFDICYERGSRIRRLHLCRGARAPRPPHNECFGI